MRDEWRACRNGECSCRQVWSAIGDCPVATIESGEWGDQEHIVSIADAPDDCMPGTLVATCEARMLGYGYISPEISKSWTRLIAAAPAMLQALERAAVDIRTGAEPTESVFRILAAINVARDGKERRIGELSTLSGSCR